MNIDATPLISLNFPNFVYRANRNAAKPKT